MAEVPSYQDEQIYTPETSTTPGAVHEPAPTEQQYAEAVTNPLTTPDDLALIRERAAFETHVQSSGEAIPENFKDAGAWFDSLKGAQKLYTQGQQEMADLKRDYAENASVNPNYNPEATAEAAPAPVNPADNPELRIPAPKELQDLEGVSPQGITEEDWNTWAMEVAVHGDISVETRDQIKLKAGFTDNMIDDYLGAQKARMREAYGEASEVVGGRENLDAMFKWASENLTYEEQVQINLGLSGPAYDITLRGLYDKFNTSSSDKPIAKEPAPLRGREPVSVSQGGTEGYLTKREWYADRRNPRFKTDRKFREAVEARMVKTDYNTIMP